MPIIPAIKPIKHHEIICQTVQIPIPSSMFERNTTNTLKITDDTGPRKIPVKIITAVIGCTLGKN